MTPIGKSVSVSFRVRVVRACVRAKLCERVRGVPSTLEARMARCPAAPATPATPATPAWGAAFAFLMTVAWVLRLVLRF